MANPYTSEQVAQFLALIKLPLKYLEPNQPRDIEFLTSLHIHTITTIPYENLTLHYSPEHLPSLEPQQLYQKIVVDGRGRGGYCMENSLLYLHVLRSLGFQVYPTGVRIRLRENGVPAGPFIGWTHIVNLVTLEDGSRWMIDVGFGGDGATRPVPLTPGHILHNMGTQDIQLIQGHLEAQTDIRDETRLWIFQYRNTPEAAWNTFYAFSELEFLGPDFSVMNWFAGSCPAAFQPGTVLAIKFLGRPAEGVLGGLEVYGKRMLVQGVMKENLGGKTRVIEEYQNEEDRIQGLKKWLGITLTAVEQASIEGRVTQLKPSVPASKG